MTPVAAGQASLLAGPGSTGTEGPASPTRVPATPPVTPPPAEPDEPTDDELEDVADEEDEEEDAGEEQPPLIDTEARPA